MRVGVHMTRQIVDFVGREDDGGMSWCSRAMSKMTAGAPLELGAKVRRSKLFRYRADE